jgi:serine protease inhibitor
LGALGDAAGRQSLVDASQGTFLKIDEEGTEAAAVTMASMNDSVEPPPVDFRVDAPFVFVIRDEVTGALMFVARVGDPSNAGGELYRGAGTPAPRQLFN